VRIIFEYMQIGCHILDTLCSDSRESAIITVPRSTFPCLLTLVWPNLIAESMADGLSVHETSGVSATYGEIYNAGQVTVTTLWRKPIESSLPYSISLC
jgi:hypothetical protein